MIPYFGDWESKENLENSFQIELDHDIEILYARYDYICYEGSAWVLYRQRGKLYEVNGSHCSCFGLEGQWDPEETTLAAMNHIIEHGTKFDWEGWDEDAAYYFRNMVSFLNSPVLDSRGYSSGR